MFIEVTTKRIDEAQIRQKLCNNRQDIGAVVGFSGLVREFRPGSTSPLELEHYPGMTEKMLSSIATEAIERFELINAAIVHRIGVLQVGDEIVYVAAASRHRQSAFDGANFMMDYLKTRAPFWKKEGDGNWVTARDEDEDAFRKWEA